MDIRIEKFQRTEEFEILSKMLCDYISELHTINAACDERDSAELENEYFYQDDTNIYLFKTNKTIIGFAFIGFGTNCHTDFDYYIEEFYILPEYRLEGYGTECAKLLLNKKLKNADSIHFYLLKDNTPAENFWAAFFSGWIDTSEKYTGTAPFPEPDHIVWKSYMRRTHDLSSFDRAVIESYSKEVIYEQSRKSF